MPDTDVRPFPLTFALPTEFRAVDLTADAATRATRLQAELDRTLPGLEDEQRLHLIVANQYAVERMLDEGVLYAATFIGRSDRRPGAASIAQFTALTREMSVPGTGRRPLEPVLDAIRRQRKNADAQYVDLEIGRCLVVVEDDRFQRPVRVTGEPADTVRHVRQIQVVFPLADRGELAFFALSTECLWDWDDYVTMMAEICKTLRWAARDNEFTSISNVLDG
ncbi:hypothetical protein BJF85_01560 [Saccharomonospora sp. CUA-673]|uniref:hypothetical protein n=1 Tax=Saccharomonospora sp. CUA-673 TaxID=1904969 RepID=UPI00095D2252|nr:hypothetical protein [Saccharomonospora sp. CUA-673]OLT45129.1 hypothetical protein BJF85_01560 [Saccharomonospora sp. CUA-673]